MELTRGGARDAICSATLNPTTRAPKTSATRCGADASRSKAGLSPAPLTASMPSPARAPKRGPPTNELSRAAGSSSEFSAYELAASMTRSLRRRCTHRSVAGCRNLHCPAAGIVLRTRGASAVTVKPTTRLPNAAPIARRASSSCKRAGRKLSGASTTPAWRPICAARATGFFCAASSGAFCACRVARLAR